MKFTDEAAGLAAIKLAGLVESSRVPLHSEKQAQARIEELLAANGMTFQREVRLSDRDIPDFMLGGLAVEVKIKGSKTAIYRQLNRYAEHERVTCILLLSGVAMGNPGQINGKPVLMASLGKGWL